MREHTKPLYRICKTSLTHEVEAAQSLCWRVSRNQLKRLPSSQQRFLVPLPSQNRQLLSSHCPSLRHCLSQRARLLQLVGFHLRHVHLLLWPTCVHVQYVNWLPCHSCLCELYTVLTLFASAHIHGALQVVCPLIFRLAHASPSLPCCQ